MGTYAAVSLLVEMECRSMTMQLELIGWMAGFSLKLIISSENMYCQNFKCRLFYWQLCISLSHNCHTNSPLKFSRLGLSIAYSNNHHLGARGDNGICVTIDCEGISLPTLGRQ